MSCSAPMIKTLEYVAVILISVGFFLSVPVSAGTYRVVLDECKKKTGLGESVCKSLVKNNLNIESCMKRAGLSEKECAKRIEEIKNDPEFTGVKSVPAVPSTPAVPVVPGRTLALPQNSVRNDDLIGRVRSKKELDISELGKRTESILGFLRSKGIDTTPIEAQFPELEKRATNLLSAYDTYRAAYIGTMKDDQPTRTAVRGDARAALLVARDAFIEHYRTSILVPIRVARNQIK